MLNNILLKIVYNDDNKRAIKTKKQLEEKISKISNISIIESGRADYTVAIGGDGTFIRAFRENVEYDTIYVGINCGTLGFLQDLNPEDISIFLQYINSGRKLNIKNIFVEKIDIFLKNGKKITKFALNEVLISGKDLKMIKFNQYIHSIFFQQIWSTAIVVATPTGNTAYIKSLGACMDFTNNECLTSAFIAPVENSVAPKIISRFVKSYNQKIELIGDRNEVIIIVDGVSLDIEKDQIKGVEVSILTEKNIKKLNMFDSSPVTIAREKLK